ncbi:uncharacterized protein B0I36DRAFT_358836 [Microdochium trichocladiopsis]|uniref:Clr5 domain-containing protein n=1 Tax=Microdochium trichocladiopsis TaxID=1682393 RepID=A0A9P8YDN7_9PEZI|nr:uncharacterized protein B0I36DRAFT_358836 [Microdochium trichocladiopsis]KAH7037086.1 hypothetical protein B0I36DRAFT_358836 [Microdochium trichocladiopsis]
MDDSPDPPPAPRRRGRPQGPGADALDLHRVDIERLRGQNAPLRRIMGIMKDKHGIRADENQYKRKLAQWGLSRKYSRERAMSPYYDHPDKPSLPPADADVISLALRYLEEDGFARTTLDIMWADDCIKSSQSSIRRWRELAPSKLPGQERSWETPVDLNAIARRFALDKDDFRIWAYCDRFHPNKRFSRHRKTPGSYIADDLENVLQQLRCSEPIEQELVLTFMLAQGHLTGLLQLIRWAVVDSRDDILWIIPHLSAEQHHLLQKLDVETITLYVLVCLRCRLLHERGDFAPFGDMVFSSSSPSYTTIEALDDLSPLVEATIASSTAAQQHLYPLLDFDVARTERKLDGFRQRRRILWPFGFDPAQERLEIDGSTMSLSHAEEIKFLMTTGSHSHLANLRTRFIKEHQCLRLAMDVPGAINLVEPDSTRASSLHRPKHARGTNTIEGIELWASAMASLHAVARGTASVGVQDALSLVCLARAVQSYGLARRAGGPSRNDSAELFLADLSNWVTVVKHHAHISGETVSHQAQRFCNVVRLTWDLLIPDDETPFNPETSSLILRQMLAAACHLIRLALCNLGVEQQGMTSSPPRSTGRPATQTSPRESERVHPGKDPPGLQASILAFVAASVAAASALGFILGLMLCMISVLANIIRFASPAPPASPFQQDLVFASSSTPSPPHIEWPVLLSRPATPEFGPWHPKTSPGPLAEYGRI